MITIKYFAALREALETEQETLTLPANVETLSSLTTWLRQRNELWRQIMSDPTLMMSVNQQLANDDTVIRDGDEVAYFPPITGG